MKGRPQRKECGSCCGLGDGVEGHRQGEEVGVGCLSFDIGWPPGVHDSGSAAGGWGEEKKKWVLRDKSCGGQGDELCSGSTMTQKASAPRYDLAKDQGVSRNEGNRAGLLKRFFFFF